MPNAPLATCTRTRSSSRVIVALSGGTMKVVNEDGTSEVHQWDTGKAYWLPLEEGKKRHADANQGNKPIEVMVVETQECEVSGEAGIVRRLHFEIPGLWCNL